MTKIENRINGLRDMIDECDATILTAIKHKRIYERELKKLLREKRVNETLSYKEVKQPDFVYIIT